MLAVLVRWLSSGGLRHIASDRHGHRDPHAALESLKQALLLTATDVARVVALALLAALLVAAALTATSACIAGCSSASLTSRSKSTLSRPTAAPR